MDEAPLTPCPPRPDAAEPAQPEGDSRQASYRPPRLEHLGPWQAFTLQQSVPIFP